MVMRGPRSYTSEDVVEVHTHGGGVCARRVLAALLEGGARLARPGEFTLRAFLNGRLDLTQVWGSGAPATQGGQLPRVRQCACCLFLHPAVSPKDSRRPVESSACP